MSRTVLVTGGSGFIGSYILRSLAERGDTVINFDIREPGPEAAWSLKPVIDRIQFVQGSVDDWANVVGAVKSYQPEAIIHTAAIVSLLSNQPSLALKVNLGGTFTILEAARLFGVQRVVYFSSIGVLPKKQYEPIDANHPVFLADSGPSTSFYAAAKVSSEAFCWAYQQSFGRDVIIVRPSAVYGFGMYFPIFIKPMVENAVRGLPTHFDRGREFPRDYTHVADVAQLAVKAVDIAANKVQDRTFYAATGRPLVTAGQLADLIKSLIPGADIEVKPGLTETDLPDVASRGIFNIQNAQEQLGYQPRFADIRDGVAEYIETFQQYVAETGVN